MSEGGYLIPRLVDADKGGLFWAIVRRFGMWLYNRGRHKYDLYEKIEQIKNDPDYYEERTITVNCAVPKENLYDAFIKAMSELDK